MKAAADSLFLGSKITEDSDSSHEIKRHLFLGRKVMTNLDSALNIRDITLLTEVRIVEDKVFPVVMYGCECWTIKKAEHWRTDAFENCGTREDSCTWRSNQSILKEINPEYSLERLMLKLKLQYFGHLMQRVDSLEKDPGAGKDWGQEEKRATEDKMIGYHHQLSAHEFEQPPGDSEGWGSLAYCHPRVTKSQTWLSDWTTKIQNRKRMGGRCQKIHFFHFKSKWIVRIDKGLIKHFEMITSNPMRK